MTASLKTDLNVTNPDGIYEQLVVMYDGLSDAESLRASATLILLLVNHIGDAKVVFEAIDAAKRLMR